MTFSCEIQQKTIILIVNYRFVFVDIILSSVNNILGQWMSGQLTFLLLNSIDPNFEVYLVCSQKESY